ncbi:helix-turn-helix transcriptional regulator [Rhodococcus fascians]|nr:helix-turn-helix transcriptional regulator [Rhodococcus fascians]MBY4139221.1 helix-turn-helix transcriptional regulator [Rhodococcus fascians]MBY4217688.1 helix-turn-helix transcriptional regulator [Rhodococcus fascians]MBY4224574.1 helix-turn-helix transcriptional regulator [Rhodococcus fascians]MBY4233724.1 helix-turn-helix transcriptional regulator [Rhodococcus fascians]
MTPTGPQNPCLAELMDARGMRDSIDLLPHLADRGVLLTESQVRRLVARRPMLVSLTTLIALCDIFGCSPVDFAPSDVHRDENRNPLPQNGNVVDINTVLGIRYSMTEY